MSDLSNSHSNPSTRPNRPTAPNLLSLQGKLLVLQDELDALDAKAASSPDPDLHSSMGSWEALMRNAKVSHNHSGKEETKRLEIAGGLEVKLKRYREFARVQNFPPINSAWMHLQEDSYQEIEERTVLTKADGMDLDKALIHSKEAMKLESPDERMSEAHRCVLKDVASGEQIKLVGAEDLVALKPPADQDIVSRTLRSHWPFPSTVGFVPGGKQMSLHQLIGTGTSIPRARRDPVLPRALPSSSVEGYQHPNPHLADRRPNPGPELHQQSERTFGHRNRIHRTVRDRSWLVDWS